MPAPCERSLSFVCISHFLAGDVRYVVTSSYEVLAKNVCFKGGLVAFELIYSYSMTKNVLTCEQ